MTSLLAVNTLRFGVDLCMPAVLPTRARHMDLDCSGRRMEFTVCH
jgi:hypothetical protein